MRILHGLPQVPCTYVQTKKGAEQEVRSAIDRGQDAVIMYPGFLLGPWDWKPSSARMILDLRRGAPPARSFWGVFDLRCSRRCAGVLEAVEQSTLGAVVSYYAGENWTYFQLWTEIASRLKRSKPWFAMRPPGRWLIGTVGDLLAKFSADESVINSAALRMGAQYHWYSSQRALDSFGYQSRPASESLDDTIAWLREQGKLDRS
jgi:dihydroflavonol-4-reductase